MTPAQRAAAEICRRIGWDEDSEGHRRFTAIIASEYAELERDAKRYRDGKQTWAAQVSSELPDIWRFCEPDTMRGVTFDAAWDAALEAK